MIKKYSLFIMTVIFSLSQPQLYGMENELFFESFGFNPEESNPTQPDFLDQTTSTSGSSDFGGQDTFFSDIDNKDLILPSFDDDKEIKEQNNGFNLFSDFLKNEQNRTMNNSTTNTVPVQKATVFLRKRSREDEKESLENQGEQKKICFNKKGAVGSKAVTNKKNPVLQLTSYWIQNPKRWLKLAIELKPQVIIKLLQKAGSSTEKLAEIENMFDKNIMRVADLLYWLFDSISEKHTPPFLQIITNQDTNQSFVHLKFILNLLNKKIYDSQDQRGTTQSMHYNALADKLEKCISKNTNPECLSLIQMSINVIKIAPKDSRRIYYIFDGISKLLNLQVSQVQQQNFTKQPIAIQNITNKQKSDSGTIVKNYQENRSVAYWTPARWIRLSLDSRQQAIVSMFKKAGKLEDQLSAIQRLFEKKSTKPSTLLGWLIRKKNNEKTPLLHIISNQDNQCSFLHFVRILNILNAKIYKNKGANGSAANKNYEKLALELDTYTSDMTCPECFGLIKKVITVVAGAPLKRRAWHICEGLKELINPPVQQTQGLNKVLSLKETQLIALQPHIQLQQQNFTTQTK